MMPVEKIKLTARFKVNLVDVDEAAISKITACSRSIRGS
jgi:hypothetical protein